MIEIISFVVMYLMVSVVVFIVIDYAIMNAMIYAEWTMDKKEREVFEDKKTRYLSTAIISLLWIIFVPILIHNTNKERGV
ncbi:hypothetical protein [uncultured Clostridium sp.]|uniref:hypothetical protein n=1 Tax=uncultured Clostridium sp. TaxID=59620 RepID=UPI0026ECFDFC|nr:hypothetical protein [uncultured Clostridium sp.]